MERERVKITVNILKAALPGAILAKGFLKDDVDDINLATTGNITPWVAKRGTGHHDWCIYAQNPHYINPPEVPSEDAEPTEWQSFFISCQLSGTWDFEQVYRIGDKISSERHIKKLVDCDDAAFQLYRY